MLQHFDRGVAAFIAVLLAGLFIAFSGRINLNSGDAALHYSLVHEISRFGGVRAHDAALTVMLIYPPAAHWLASIIGWIGGSDLVAMVLICIAATFLSYFFAARLAEDRRGISALVVFGLLIIAFSKTNIIVGREVTVDFFYAQLVGNVFIFGFLFWSTFGQSSSPWHVAIVTPLVGAAVMWVQPIASIHILGTGIALLALGCIRSWRTNRLFGAVIATAFLIGASAAVVRLHPMMQIMRTIAKNDGAIGLGLSNATIALTAIGCLILGCASIWRYLQRGGLRVDAVVGCAIVSACGLMILQYFAWMLFKEGSPYAVKKHLFLIVTLGLLNAARLLSVYWPLGGWKYGAPIIATLATSLIFYGRGVEMRPLLDALSFANHAALFAFPDLRPGNTVSADTTMSPVANIIVSVSAFGYPMDQRPWAWQLGAAPEDDAEYAMIRRADDGPPCPAKVESAEFVILETHCLKTYFPDQILSFVKARSSFRFARSGWYGTEQWGTWANENGELLLRLPSDRNKSYELVVNAQAFVTPSHPTQTVNVVVNDRQVAEWIFQGPVAMQERRATIPAELIRDETIKINFVAPGAVSPAQVALSNDTRVLGIGLKTLQLSDR